MQYQSIEWLMLAWRRQKQKTAMAFPEKRITEFDNTLAGKSCQRESRNHAHADEEI